MAPALPGYALAVLGIALGAARAIQLFQWTANPGVLSSVIVHAIRAGALDRAEKYSTLDPDAPMMRMVRAVLDANARVSTRDPSALRAELDAALAATRREEANRVTGLQFVSVTSLAATGFGVAHGVVVGGGASGALIFLALVTVALFASCLWSTHRLLVAGPRGVQAVVEALVDSRTRPAQ